MHRSFAQATLFALLPLAYALCPLYGPSFPQPTYLAESSILKEAFKGLTEYLDGGLRTGNSSNGPVVPAAAHAVQIFSLNDPKPIFEYYHDGTTLANSPGVNTVDGTSIFRIGSISKLVTVYLVLATLGDEAWSIRVTDVIPELQNRTKSRENPVDYVDWDEITLGALAGQVSGVTRDVFAPYSFPANPGLWGLPPLTPPEFEECVLDPVKGNNCNRATFFRSLDRRQPVYLPNTKAIYSNTAFVILRYALESMTGNSFEDMLRSTIIDTLALDGFSYRKPVNDSLGVIPYNTTFSNWDRELGEAGPMGGNYASLNDLTKIGRSILNSTIVDSATTREWLQPTAFNTDLISLVGRPWEIYRAAGIPNRAVIDIYSKGGSSGSYQTYLAVVPDFNIGFTAAVAGGGDHAWINAYIADKIFAALEEEARSQADAAYAGTYVATNGLNTTLTLITEPDLPGLAVTKFISNGTSFLATLGFAVGNSGDSNFLRFYPTNIKRQTEDGTEFAWRASPELYNPVTSGPYSACVGWFNVDGISHGDHAFDQMVFKLNEEGKATTLSPKAFRIELTKET